mmetsp:Transcript_7727/g.12356  ORF Transcript_7727/g.12356 Transcript_7727/m.12356 type:complete len:402 (+) Transcript_7727:65-1270(+)
MTLAAMPMLIVNLGGEMMYILEQRLRAQAIPPEKSKKVLEDVIRTMYNKKFIDELFKPQEMYSNHSARQIFDRLAHSSIMRLSESSMDKLYDLMTMGFKYQLLAVCHPGELLQVMVNHLDALRVMVDKTPVAEMVESVLLLTLQKYGSMSVGELALLRHTAARFFQDKRVKVSLFLQDGIQNTDGTVILPSGGPVPPGAEVPGTIKFFDENDKVTRTEKVSLGSAAKSVPFDVSARPTTLGVNLYNKERSSTAAADSASSAAFDDPHSATASSPSSKYSTDASGGGGKGAGAASRPSSVTASQELNILARLIGTSNAETQFKINLFSDGAWGIGGGALSSSQSGPSPSPTSVQQIKIDASKSKGQSMSEMMQKFKLDDPSAKAKKGATTGDDLLDLMDQSG